MTVEIRSTEELTTSEYAVLTGFPILVVCQS